MKALCLLVALLCPLGLYGAGDERAREVLETLRKASQIEINGLCGDYSRYSLENPIIKDFAVSGKIVEPKLIAECIDQLFVEAMWVSDDFSFAKAGVPATKLHVSLKFTLPSGQKRRVTLIGANLVLYEETIHFNLPGRNFNSKLLNVFRQSAGVLLEEVLKK